MSELAGYEYNYITVPLYDTLGVTAIEFIVNQTEMEIIIASVDKASIVLDMKASLPTVKTVIVMGEVTDALASEAKQLDVNIISWTDVEKNGRDRPVEAVHPTTESVATICYTSGTTGTPKYVWGKKNKEGRGQSFFLYYSTTQQYERQDLDWSVRFR
jgi:long-chain acyl-CoA synthetase